MKWTIFDPETNTFIHPRMDKHPNYNITFQDYDKCFQPYYFDDTHKLTDFLRGIDENGNLSASIEGFMYMMCLEERP